MAWLVRSLWGSLASFQSRDISRSRIHSCCKQLYRQVNFGILCLAVISGSEACIRIDIYILPELCLSETHLGARERGR